MNDVEHDTHSVDGVKTEKNVLPMQLGIGKDALQGHVKVVTVAVVGKNGCIFGSSGRHLELLNSTDRLSRVAHNDSEGFDTHCTVYCSAPCIPSSADQNGGRLLALLKEVMANASQCVQDKVLEYPSRPVPGLGHVDRTHLDHRENLWAIELVPAPIQDL